MGKMAFQMGLHGWAGPWPTNGGKWEEWEMWAYPELSKTQ